MNTPAHAAEIQKKLIHMVRFIEQEAHEKADEIDARTEEEFNILKGDFIQNGRLKIMKEYEKKEADCLRREKINSSCMSQRSKITILETKIQHIQHIFDAVKGKIQVETECSKKASYILQTLILEGLYKLMERHVKIRCRKMDGKKILELIPSIEAIYKHELKRNVSLTIDETFLDKHSLGGVFLITDNNKIKVDNTLDSRLDQIFRNVSPVLSSIFYGTSKMRSQK